MENRKRSSRRDVLSASARLLLAGCSLSIFARVADVSADQNAAPFSARNAMRFADMPDTASVGLPSVYVAYAGQLWPKQASKAEPDISFLSQKALPPLRKLAPHFVIIDIEHWHLTDPSPADIERNIDRYIIVVETFRQALPGVRLGFYGMIPIRNYWAPVKGNTSALTNWRTANRRLQRLADSVDVIFPSLYTFEDDEAAWTAYATANISEAQQYGKPVHGFLWPQYHGTRHPIAAPFWRLQLETVHAHADGMVIWSPAKGKPRWDPNAPWWQETVDFLKTSGLAH